MKYGRLNIIVGSIVIILGGIGGFILGATLDGVVRDGSYAVPYVRIFLRSAHTHGLLFSLYNLAAGMLVDRLRVSDRMKKATSLLVALALLLPAGLLLRGIDGGGMTFAPVVLTGGLVFVTSGAFLLTGAIKGID